MKVKDLKTITSTSTTMTLWLSKTREDAYAEKWEAFIITYALSKDYANWDNFKVVYVQPMGKDELYVWCVQR